MLPYGISVYCSKCTLVYNVYFREKGQLDPICFDTWQAETVRIIPGFYSLIHFAYPEGNISRSLNIKYKTSCFLSDLSCLGVNAPGCGKGVFWRPIDQDQVLITWSEGRQNGLVLNLRLCDVTALQASKSDIKIK